jgi:DNA polymerase-1
VEYAFTKLKERDYEKFFLELEMPCLKVLFEMEEKGVSIDSEELKKQSAEIELRIIELEKEIYGMAEGVEFNIGSKTACRSFVRSS